MSLTTREGRRADLQKSIDKIEEWLARMVRSAERSRIRGDDLACTLELDEFVAELRNDLAGCRNAMADLDDGAPAAEPEPDPLPEPEPVCPRCHGPIPDAEHVGQYPGAFSRASTAESPIEVCSACGSDEAYEDHCLGGATKVVNWPVKTRTPWSRL